jgi:hypothetical protein
LSLDAAYQYVSHEDSRGLSLRHGLIEIGLDGVRANGHDGESGAVG